MPRSGCGWRPVVVAGPPSRPAGSRSSLGSSGVAERNLNRFTTLMAIVWGACIILLGILTRFNS